MPPGAMEAMLAVFSTIMGQMNGQKGGQGSTYNKEQLSTIDDIIKNLKGGVGGPNQDITQNQNYQQGSEWLSNLFGNDQGFWNQFEAPLMRQFNEEIAPGVANRFAAEGSGGSLGSTGFRNQLAREGSNLSTNIAALRGGMQQQGVNQALQYGQQPIHNWMQQLQSVLNPTQNTYQGPSTGGWGSVVAPLIQAASSAYNGQSQNPGQNPTTI